MRIFWVRCGPCRLKGMAHIVGKSLLILDALDLLLATAGLNASPVRLGDMLMDCER